VALVMGSPAGWPTLPFSRVSYALRGERHNSRQVRLSEERLMPPTCTVCRHPQRQTIESMLAAGWPLRNIAERFATSATALHRHKAHAHLRFVLETSAKCRPAWPALPRRPSEPYAGDSGSERFQKTIAQLAARGHRLRRRGREMVPWHRPAGRGHLRRSARSDRALRSSGQAVAARQRGYLDHRPPHMFRNPADPEEADPIFV